MKARELNTFDNSFTLWVDPLYYYSNEIRIEIADIAIYLREISVAPIPIYLSIFYQYWYRYISIGINISISHQPSFGIGIGKMHQHYIVIGKIFKGIVSCVSSISAKCQEGKHTLFWYLLG